MRLWKLTACLWRMEKNACLSRDALDGLREKRLRALLRFAWDRCPYYREAYEKAGFTAEDMGTVPLASLPTVDKSILTERFGDITAVPGLTQQIMRRADEEGKTLSGGVAYVHTSGSTGTPFYFAFDEDGWDKTILGVIRGALWGMSLIDRIKLFGGGLRILILAAADGRYAGVTAIGDGVGRLGGKCLFLDLNTPLSEWKTKIRAFRPNVVIGYPSALSILASLMEAGEADIRLKRAVTCGEPLSPSLRARLEETFGIGVVNFYGASESPAMGVELDPAEGMILFDDMNIIEQRDGELLLTNLTNRAVPLIRYRIRDSLTIMPAAEESACAFTRARGGVFREDDLLWFRRGDGELEYLHPLALEGFALEGLKDFQFVQEGERALLMLAVAEPDHVETRERISDAMRAEMARILETKHLQNIRFRIEFTNRIDIDRSTGKKRLTVAHPSVCLMQPAVSGERRSHDRPDSLGAGTYEIIRG